MTFFKVTFCHILSLYICSTTHSPKLPHCSPISGFYILKLILYTDLRFLLPRFRVMSSPPQLYSLQEYFPYVCYFNIWVIPIGSLNWLLFFSWVWVMFCYFFTWLIMLDCILDIVNDTFWRFWILFRFSKGTLCLFLQAVNLAELKFQTVPPTVGSSWNFGSDFFNLA